MRRRDFGKASLGVIASTVLVNSPKGAEVVARSDFPKAPGVTDYVARFVTTTRYEDIPGEEIGRAHV